MTNAEKIIAELIDQGKLNGNDAVILIKSLSKEDGISNLSTRDIWKGQYPNTNTVLYNSQVHGSNPCQSITGSNIYQEYSNN